MVSLTEKGTAHFAAMAQAHEAWIDELLGNLSVSEGQQIISMLRRIRQPED